MLTLGGDAELELVDQGDPFAEGTRKNISVHFYQFIVPKT